VDVVLAGGFTVFLWAERFANKHERFAALESFSC
jgi:hypothetical protein